MKSAFVLLLADLSVFRRNMEKNHMFILFKMVNVESTSITIDEVVSYVLVDAGSDIENFSSESESSESSDDNQPLTTVAIPNN